MSFTTKGPLEITKEGVVTFKTQDDVGHDITFKGTVKDPKFGALKISGATANGNNPRSSTGSLTLKVLSERMN